MPGGAGACLPPGAARYGRWRGVCTDRTAMRCDARCRRRLRRVCQHPHQRKCWQNPRRAALPPPPACVPQVSFWNTAATVRIPATPFTCIACSELDAYLNLEAFPKYANTYAPRAGEPRWRGWGGCLLGVCEQGPRPEAPPLEALGTWGEWGTAQLRACPPRLLPVPQA